jgi:hypothetical protein
MSGFSAPALKQGVLRDLRLALTIQLYVGGVIDYLDVVVAQQTELTALTVEVQVQVEVSRMQASVGLIRAVGGLEHGGSPDRGRGAALRTAGHHWQRSPAATGRDGRGCARGVQAAIVDPKSPS